DLARSNEGSLHPPRRPGVAGSWSARSGTMRYWKCEEGDLNPRALLKNLRILMAKRAGTGKNGHEVDPWGPHRTSGGLDSKRDSAAPGSPAGCSPPQDPESAAWPSGASPSRTTRPLRR